MSCPSSNRNIGAGILDLTKPLNAGVNVCIGTDSPASSDGYDLFNELRLALEVDSDNRIPVNGFDALRMITVNPSRALGFDRDIGTIEPGKSADLIALRISDKIDSNPDNIHEEIFRNISADDIALTISMGKVRYTSIDGIPVEDPIES